MTERKAAERPYPPDFVSAETLAYRLDCSRATIDAYVRTGMLPKPRLIGSLLRWEFNEVRAFIAARNGSPAEIGANGRPRDEYLERLKRGTPA